MDRQHQQEELQAPEALITALKSLPREDIFIPPTLDEGILRTARRHLLGKVKQPRGTWFWLKVWASVATAVSMLALLLFSLRPGATKSNASSFAREDLNHDRRVDILDAFALAKQLAGPAQPDLRLDINGDGKVNEQDAALIAKHAVRLEKGGRS